MNPDLLRNVTVLARQMDVLCSQMRAEVATLEARLQTAIAMVTRRAAEVGIDPNTLWVAPQKAPAPQPENNG